MNKKTGFSLIELLIVVLIVGIISSMAVLYIDTAHERLKSEVQHLVQMIQSSRAEAIISGKPTAMVFKVSDYYFSRWDGKQWQKIDARPFKVVSLEDDIKLAFYRSGTTETVSLPLKNMVYFLPTGETEDFWIELSNAEKETYRIKISLMGELSVEQVGN